MISVYKRFGAALFFLIVLSLFSFLSTNAFADDLEVSVTTSSTPISGANVYAYTEAGSYTGVNTTTDSSGVALFDSTSFETGNYKFRADYLGSQFWSDVISVPAVLTSAISITEETADVTVTSFAGPSQSVPVYLFSDAGSYLGINKTTDTNGQVSFDLPVGHDFKFRANTYGNQYWSSIITIQSGTNDVSIDTGGGILQATIEKNAGSPLEGISTYLFNASGAYMGFTQTTDASGIVQFSVPEGDYKVRANYMGYQYWSADTTVTANTDISVEIPHQDTVVTIQAGYQGSSDPIEGVNVYLFTSSGSYMGQVQSTDSNGQVTFNLPEESYKVRANYMGQQFWSNDFTWQDSTVDIPMADGEVTVTGMGQPLEDVNVYLFTESGSYLGINQATDSSGSTTFRTPAGPHKFRADYQGSQYWSDVETLIADQSNPVAISTGGGIFTLAVTKGATPLTGANCYLFTESGSYLGLNETTDSNGEGSFAVADGSYKIRVDYLGNQFWSDVYTVPDTLSGSLDIPHQDVAITVQSSFQSSTAPIEGVNVYLFTSSGSYMGQVQATDSSGQVTFNLPEESYKVRADYMGQQFWSDDFTWQDTTVDIPMADAEVAVTGMGQPLEDVNVYLFTESGSYLGINQATDSIGSTTFRTPAGSHKFRADYQGSQFWSDIETLIADQVNPVAISTGGGIFTLAVTKGATPLTGANCYLFTESGSYLGLNETTDSNGEVSFAVADGSYKIRVDYLGNQFWSDVYTVPDTLTGSLDIPHQDVTITVQSSFQSSTAPIEGVNVYLFTSSGSYMGQVQATDSNGQVTFNLPEESYKVRANYMGQQFWSNDFTWQNTTVDIPMADGEVTVTGMGQPLEDVSVYLFTESGSYLGINQATDSNGNTTFRGPAGSYKFRADYQGSQFWSNVETLVADQVNPVAISTGGGVFSFSVTKGAEALTGANCYLFTESGSYLGLNETTDSNGEVSFTVADGSYMIRVDYLGNQFWSDVYTVPDTLSGSLDIPHQDVIITVQDSYQGAQNPLEGVNVYLFTSSGPYMGQNQATDSSGQVTFNLPQNAYKVRADYMGQQYWSSDFTWQDSTITISKGTAQIHVTRLAVDLEGAVVYLFTGSGSYLGQSKTTDYEGTVEFLIPAGTYNFRINEGGDQRWSGEAVINAEQMTAIQVEMDDTLPPTVSISADPVDIGSNESSTLTWTSTNTDTVSIDQEIGEVNLNGSILVSPAETTLYTITAEGSNGTVSATVTVNIVINNIPSITIIEPDGVDDTADASYTIEWTDDDPDNDADISLYYDTDNSGADGVLIVSGLSEDDDGAGDSYLWDTTDIEDASYYIYASINDGINDPVVVYSSGVLNIEHAQISDVVKIVPADIDLEDYFGVSVFIDGDYAIVGAPGIANYTGSAYIFKKEGNSWVEQTKLTASDASEWAEFGFSVSINGDYAIVGAPYTDDYSGAVYIYKLEGGVWIEQTKLLAADNPGEAGFGYSVFINGDYAIVSAPYADNYSGTAYIFKLENDAWIEQSKLVASDAVEDDFFGESVSLSGDYAIVGASGALDYSGAAYIFKKDGSSWVEHTKLTPTDTTEAEYFGISVSINSNYAIVGASDYSTDEEWYLGAAYIFKLDGDAWVEESKLVANDGMEDAYMGWSVAMSGNCVIAGAPWDSTASLYSGSAYLFQFDNSLWSQKDILIASDPEENAKFGYTTSISGNYAIVGVPGKSEAYIYYIEWIAPVPQISASAAPETVLPGEESIITWNSENAESVIINQGIGAVDLNGSISVYPTQHTTYTLTASGEGGTTWTSVTVRVNSGDNYPPYITLTEPDGINDVITGKFAIKWSDNDIDDNASISLYYDTDNSGSDGVLIVSGLSEDDEDEGDQYTWDTSAIPDGDYYIYAVIDDYINSPHIAYSRGVVSLKNNTFNEIELIYWDSEQEYFDGYGTSVTIDGDYAAVGAEDLNMAFIFDTQGNKLPASEILDGIEGFKNSVSINGDNLMISSNEYAGIYKREEDIWEYTPSIPDSMIGRYIDIDGDYAITGTGNEWMSDPDGYAFIYHYNGDEWVEEAALQSSDEDLAFGGGVAISGEYAIIGGSGKTYIYKREGTSWAEQFQIPLGNKSDFSDGHVSIDGDYAIIAENSENAVYIYKRVGTDWIQQARLAESYYDASGNFGTSVAIHGDYAIVGAVWDWGDGENVIGAAYLYKRSGSTWSKAAKILPKADSEVIWFGRDVDLDGAHAIVGAYCDDWYYGAAYLFTLPRAHIGVDNEVINVGGSATLLWNCGSEATYVSISNGIGEVPSEGNITVTPTETTTYVITATGPWGTETASVTVVVAYPPSIDAIVLSDTVIAGDSTIISWNSSGAESVSINQEIGEVDLTGTIEVFPSETTTYTITATIRGMTATYTVTVEVLGPTDDIEYGVAFDEQEGGGSIVGETVRLSNGNVMEARTDIQFPSPNQSGLVFESFYNSRSDDTGSTGYGWINNYEASLDIVANVKGLDFIKIIDETGRAHYFTEDSEEGFQGVFIEKSKLADVDGTYVWYRLDGTQMGFTPSGKLEWIDDPVGNRLQLSYDGSDRLLSVTDSASSRVITFNYNADNLLDHITGPVTNANPDGVWITYGYDSENNLISVTYPDGSGINYDYTDANDIHNLTEKTNMAGHLINTWEYNSDDRAVSNFSRYGRGVSIAYDSDIDIIVTDAYGKEREYLLDYVAGRLRVTNVTTDTGSAGVMPYNGSNAVSWSYDDQMRLLEAGYAGGAITQYQDYDERGNPGTVIIAAGESEERTVHFTYHPDMNVPLTRTEPSVLGSGNKETIWDYDDDYDSEPNEAPTALVSRIIEKGFTKDESNTIVAYEYVTTLYYNSKGQVVSMDGPLPGTGDTASFDYDPLSGNLLSQTKPIVGSITLSGYDDAGQMGMITDLNNRSKSFTYDEMGRVTAVTNNVDSSAIETAYNIAGKVEYSADEDGVSSDFEYDATYGRTSRRIDYQGNYIRYEYDDQGNVIEKSYYNSDGILSKRTFFSYKDDESNSVHTMPGLLYRETDDDGNYTQYTYDSAGNIYKVRDPRGTNSQYMYDPLNRLEMSIEPGLVTYYRYDDHGNLRYVKPSDNDATTYEYDDMGRVVTTTSPDTGTVTYVYDEGGNPVQKTDARGITVEYVYDVLNRLTNVNFPDSDEDVTYTYDEGTNGIGQRTGMEDESGSMVFRYDNRGRLYRKTSTISGVSYTLSRSFTPGSRVNSITYPSGRTVDYERSGCVCQINGVTTAYDGETTTLMGGVSYRAFGTATKVSSWASSSIENIHDNNGRLRTSNPAAQTETIYDYDNNGNLTSVEATNNPDASRSYAYFLSNKLGYAIGGGDYGVFEYTYDSVGNRETKTYNGVTDTYSYISGTSKLDQITGERTITYGYDENGNTTQINNRVLTYNQNNRLIRVEEDGDMLGEYIYNGMGQRIKKTAYGFATKIFHYDFDGNLIAESEPRGKFLKEYLYMGDVRLAMVDVLDDSVYMFINDNLGTPQSITDAEGNVVWQASYQPFGKVKINPNSTIENNFRFKGQYYDNETGFHYNYHRYYDPATGRYLTPDPVGLLGGANLFAYASNNPINKTDKLGLLDEFTSAVPKGRDVIYFSDGYSMISVRSGGTRAWRNNNPGNIRVGSFANKHNAIGKAGGFAVFPDYVSGRNALKALLQTNTYMQLSVAEAIERYAPVFENDTAAYQRFVTNYVGVDPCESMGSLNSDQMESLADAIQRMEGFREGSTRLFFNNMVGIMPSLD